MKEVIEKLEEVQVLAEAEHLAGNLELSDLNDINVLIEKFKKLEQKQKG